MKLPDILKKIASFFKHVEHPERRSKEEYSIRNEKVSFLDIPKSMYLVIKKYGLVVFWYKFLKYNKYLLIRFSNRIKSLYFKVRRFHERRGGRALFVYIINYIFRRSDFFNTRSIALSVASYKTWISINELYASSEIDKEIDKFKYKPKISIITPVYNVDPRWLNKCVQSVLNQSYGNWELCLHDDASTNRKTVECLRNWEKVDSRIKVSYGEINQHISGASNEALKLATGEFVALLDNDDELAPTALYENVRCLNIENDLDFIYSDEDKIDKRGVRSNPFFKPDWSPDLFYSLNYICHFSVIRKEIGDKLGWFRKGMEGAQDYDLFLRIVTTTKNIKHISKVLYHWRMLDSSTAKSITAKSYANEAGKKALRDFCIKNDVCAKVENGYGDTNYRLIYNISGDDLVSIIIPFKDKIDVLKKCVKSILDKTHYKNYELILVSNNSVESSTFKYLKKLKNKNIKVLRRDVQFNFSSINNWAVTQSSGKYILFLNNDTEVISPFWLEEMIMHASRKEIGAVGALLYYPDGTIQHAGVILGMTGLAGHIFSKQSKLHTYENLACHVRNYLAVTAACMLISREKFQEVGGFDERFTVCGNDVDLCLKLYERGYLNLYTPYAELYHYESLTRDKIPPRCDYDISVKRYAAYIGNDPYYNVNLSLNHEAVYINTK